MILYTNVMYWSLCIPPFRCMFVTREMKQNSSLIFLGHPQESKPTKPNKHKTKLSKSKKPRQTFQVKPSNTKASKILPNKQMQQRQLNKLGCASVKLLVWLEFLF